MNKRAEIILRRVEQSLFKIDEPTRARNDAFGQGRTILPNSKVRELENLVSLLAECQELINNDGQDESQQAWLDGVKQQLKARLELVFAPPMLVIERNQN